MAGSAASAAAGQVANLAVQEVSFLCGVHDAVESLREDWRSLQTFLSVEAQRGSGVGDAIAADSLRRVRDAAYEAENIIDAADYRVKRNSRRKGMLGVMSRYAHKPMDLIARHKLGKDVLRWRKKIQDIKSSREFLDAMKAGAPEPRANHTCRSCLAVDCGDEEFVVGLERDVERIEEWLKNPDNPQLTVISLVAMGGAGKTTLARKVYSSTAAEEYFDALAFVSISQQFEVLPVLKEIATQAMGIRREERGFEEIGMSGQADELKNMNANELTRMLHNFLNGKRYLIALDDVWRTDTWDAIQHAFPDEGNGSRVMLTTRKMQVAKQANKLTHVHEVMLLNEEESWQLLSLKAFPSYENIHASNRQEFETVGKNLAKKCSGLPLSLVILGSYLSKNLSLDTWSKMDLCLNWEVTSKGENIKQIIALSYDDLTSHFLKHCFLYIASFPEDYRIHIDFLTSSWIAEGFLPHRPNQTLEDISYDCLQELSQRSMIRVYWDHYLGRISTIQIHDSLREWAIQQAKKEGFLNVCKHHDNVSDGISACRSSFLDYFDEKNCMNAPNTRSVLGFKLSSVTLGPLRFLRVIYMSDSNLEKVSKVLGYMIHLRYIGLIRCRNVVLPSTIGKLLNLQSIDLSQTHIPRLPKSLWDIPTLRNVEIPEVGASFDFTTIRAEEQSELQTLYIESKLPEEINKLGTDSSRWIRLKKYLMRMAQLRTLVLGAGTYALPADVLVSLKDNHHLEILLLHAWESGAAFPETGRLPPNLRSLYLYFLCSTWKSWHADLLPTLGRLQSLRSFYLVGNYQGDDAEDPDEQLISQHCQKVGVTTNEDPIMYSPAGAFPRLRYLTLSGVQANKLRFQAGTMPKLTELRLAFGDMTTVPDGLFDLPSLEKLVLHKMDNMLPRETHELIESKGIKVTIIAPSKGEKKKSSPSLPKTTRQTQENSTARRVTVGFVRVIT